PKICCKDACTSSSTTIQFRAAHSQLQRYVIYLRHFIFSAIYSKRSRLNFSTTGLQRGDTEFSAVEILVSSSQQIEPKCCHRRIQIRLTNTIEGLKPIFF